MILLQLNNITNNSVQFKASKAGTFNLVYNVQYTRCKASPVLFALASNGLMVRWTLHRDSLTWRLVCSSGNRWWCTDLSITSRFFRMTATVTPLALYWLEHSWPAPKTVPPPNSVHQCEIQFCLSQQIFTTLTIVESVTTTSCFTTQSFTQAFKFLRTTVLSSRDFSDVPVILIPGNIHLQCKQAHYAIL